MTRPILNKSHGHRAIRSTLPTIFVKGALIGGADEFAKLIASGDLAKLIASGELDRLLA